MKTEWTASILKQDHNTQRVKKNVYSKFDTAKHAHIFIENTFFKRQMIHYQMAGIKFSQPSFQLVEKGKSDPKTSLPTENKILYHLLV